MKVAKIPFRKKLALSIFQKYKYNESRIHPLKYILWECTLRCNLNCLHCGSDCSKDALIKDMPASDFLKALDQLKGIVVPNKTMIVLTGGETLLRNDITEIGIQLYLRGFPWGVVTNGMLLNLNKLDSLLNAGLRSITVSLDGLEPSHNWLRGNPKSFSNALNAIKLLPKVPNLVYDVVTCVNQMNFNELSKLRDLLIQSSVKNWRIFTIFPTGRAQNHQDLFLSPHQMLDLMEFIKHTRNEQKIKLDYGCEGFLGNYEAEVRDQFFFCRAGINIASILIDGSISACPNLRSNFIQGNIYTDNFAEVWKNRYHQFRNREWTKIGICASCEFYKYCQGNGMHLRDELTGTLKFCHFKHLKLGEI